MKRIFQNEPAAVTGAFIALLAVLKAFLRWGGIDVPNEVDTTVQVAIGAWVGLILRQQVAPILGPQNATVKAVVEGTGDGTIPPNLKNPSVQ